MSDLLEYSNEVQETLGNSYMLPGVDDSELDAGKFFFFCFKKFLLFLLTLKQKAHCIRKPIQIYCV